MVGGSSSANILAEYFPIMINKGVKPDSKFGLPFDLLFVDKSGIKYYPEVVNAVFHGIEIETSNQTYQASASSSKKSSSTIDI
jgi:hypothetical protein